MRSVEPESDSFLRALEAISRGGRAGRMLAAALDLARAAGPAYAWVRVADVARSRRRAREAPAVDPRYLAIWSDAADELGARLERLPAGFIELRTRSAWTRVHRQWVMLDDAVTLRFALEKALVHRQLIAHDLPVPEHLEFRAGAPTQALEFLDDAAGPCVVKPMASGFGSGVTSHVRSRGDFIRARIRAARIDDRLLIERQVPGTAYRLLYLDGVLLDVLRRLPPQVTGDGRTPIAGLIADENRRRRPARVGWPIDLDCILTLRDAGRHLQTVLASGETAVVKTVISQGDSETVREPISPELESEGRAAAEAIGLRLAGVDIVTGDLSRPLRDSGGAILEVNGAPGLAYHYDVIDPDHATRVAVPILRALLMSSSDALPRPGSGRSG